MPAISTTAAMAAPHEPDVSRLEHDSLIRKVAWRLMPLIMVCYLFAFFDRINISFAKFQLQGALGRRRRSTRSASRASCAPSS